MNKPAETITVGRLTGVFGIKGWVKVKSFTEPADNLLGYAPLLFKTRHGMKQFEVEAHQQRPQGMVLKLEGIDDRNAAEAIAPADIVVDRSVLPTLEDGEFYWHELTGLRVISCYGGAEKDLGIVDRLLATGANDVLAVKPDADSIDNNERLVPYVPDVYVRNIDLDKREILVDWDPDFL